jgi:RNA recognition motif-containing protein
MQLNPKSSSWYPPPGLPSLNETLIPLTIIDEVEDDININYEENKCIFVNKLPLYTTSEDIYNFFSKYGFIRKVDYWNIKNFCHVYMKSVADANKIVNMKNFDFLGVTITVEFSKKLFRNGYINKKKMRRSIWESFCVKLIKAIKSIPDENKYGVSDMLIAKEITDIFREKDIETNYTLFHDLIRKENDHSKIINAVANTPSIIAASNPR